MKSLLKAQAFLLVTLVAGASLAADGAADPIVQMIRQSGGANTKLSMCFALQSANMAVNDAAAAKKRSDAVRLVSQKIKSADAGMLRARADVARKGLYGFKKDEAMAQALYERAKNPEAGFNAALMMYQSKSFATSPEVSKRILQVLYKSGAAKESSRGLVGSQAHYLAGKIHETGTAGEVNLKKAFLHYRSSARNTYVPGIFLYLQMLMRSLPKLSEEERQFALQEIRLMTNRWRWQSPDIMVLNGDLYAGKWFPDDSDGFFAQYHWRIAQKMSGKREMQNFDEMLQKRIKRLTKEKESRLDNAVQAAMRNITNNSHDMDFIDLCAE